MPTNHGETDRNRTGGPKLRADSNQIDRPGRTGARLTRASAPSLAGAGRDSGAPRFGLKPRRREWRRRAPRPAKPMENFAY